MVSLWTPAYIGIGSNLADPQAQVRRGFEALARLSATRLIARSSLYRTQPVGPRDQPQFVNAVAGLLTQLSADELLRNLKALETELGRTQPVVRWGPRVIDFDLLVCGAQRIDTPELKVPHAEIDKRAFVLAPLFEIAPELDVPGLGRVRALLMRCSMSGVEKL